MFLFRKKPTWRQQGAHYFSLAEYFRGEFGFPVRKISIDAGFSCPNIDGTLSRTGCIFCNNRSFSPSRRLGACAGITRQVDEAVLRLAVRGKGNHYIAYFQPATNTYAPVERLRPLFLAALENPHIVGLAIGTRPDTLPDDVLDLIAEISREHWVQLEIGLQSANDETLKFLNRGHDCAAFVDAVQRAAERKIRLGVHVILGIPPETADDRRRTAELVASLPIETIKLHNLCVVRNTPLADLWSAGEISLPSCAEYAAMAVDFLERQNPEAVIDRVAGDAPPEFLLAPDWSAKKHTVREMIRQEFQRRGTYQGKRFR